MPHFFVKTSDIVEDMITISEKAVVHHLVRVLRVKEGEKLLLADENRISYEAVVQEIGSDKVLAKILSSKKSNNFLKTNLWLAQGVLKNDAQAFVIQKATELGVKGIVPLMCDNSVLKPSVVDSKIDKWQKTAMEAVKQCERTDVPEICSRKTLEDILKSSEFDIKIACVERVWDFSLKEFLKTVDNFASPKILLIIGPEGGFSQRENELFDKYNTPKITLGKLILRAETAVISALSNVIYELEETAADCE